MKCSNCHRVGLAVSALLHLGVAGAFIAARAELASVPAADRAVPITLAMFQAAPPAVEPVLEPEIEPQPEPPPPPPPKPEPPKPKPKPKVERKPDPPPPVKQTAPSRPTVTQPEQPAPAAAAPLAAVQAPPAPVAQAPVATPAERERYLAQLLSHIERSKFYPTSARRRGLEGVVKVSFVLLADGRIRDLAVSGAHSILEKAAAEAMRQALPLPRPPAGIACPHHVQFGMEFRLR
ncbi:MAG: TonB family protein [Gammaproteobacteria bacterium]